MDWPTVIASTIAFAGFYNTWDSGFVYDDNRAILSNEDVLPHTSLCDLLLHDFWGTPLEHSGSHGSYRPLAVLSFRLNVALAGGRSARGFHVFNTLLHAATTAAFTRWVHTITRRRYTPWVSGILFAVHPIHTEAVAGVVGRADVGAALFFMLALLAYHKHTVKNGMWYLAATLLLGACAMFTKEQGITVLAICVLYELLIQTTSGPTSVLKIILGRSHKTRKEKRCLRSLTALVTCTVFLLILRTWLTGGNIPKFASADNPASRCDSFITRTLTFLYLPAFNFGLLLCPSILSFDWSMDSIPLIKSTFDNRNVISFIFYCALFWSFRINMIPLTNKDIMNTVDVNFNLSCKSHQELNLKTKMTSTNKSFNFVYDHILSYLYICFPKLLKIPILNNSNGTSEVVSKSSYSNPCQCIISEKKRKTSAVKSNKMTKEMIERRQDCVVVLIGLLIMVISFLPASNLVAYVGFVVAERILYIPSFGFCLLFGHSFSYIMERMSKINSRKKNVIVSVMFIMLNVVFVAFGMKTITRNLDWRSEESLYRSGIPINPPKAYGNLGNILSLKGLYEEAEYCYLKALQFRPNMADVHYNLGVLFQSHQRFEEAIHRYHVAIQYRSRLAVAHLNLGLVLGHLKRQAEAKSVLRRCSSLDGKGLRDLRTHEVARIACLFHLGRLAMEHGELQEAVDVFLEAIKIRPHFYAPQSLFNMLGEAYSRLGRDSDAEQCFRASLSTRPDHVPAHLTYGKLLARNRTRLGEAEEWYIRAERLAPADASVFRHYGQFLLAQERYGEAVNKLEHAILLSNVPEYEDLVSAATAFRLAGDVTSAEKYYKLAISLRPKEPSSLANLGALYHLIGRLEEAELYYQETLKLLPNDDVTITNLKKLRNLKTMQKQKNKLNRK